MFDQIRDPKTAGNRSWKERLVEGAVIFAVVGMALGCFCMACW
jgi:hypothetical protein